MPPAPDIVGIGVCTLDHLVTVPRMPKRNENMAALNYDRQPGGLASIALIAAARLGARAKIIARIGEDDTGAYIRRVLQDEGVDASQLLLEPGSESHVSVILVHEASGDRSIITRPPTGKPIAASEFRREDISAARVLFIDALNDATMQAARWAKEAGMTVLLDPSLPYQEIKPLLRFVDVPIVPEYWARDLMPDEPPAAVAERLRDEGAQIAAVTLGERGAVVAWEAGTQAFPAYEVDVVDTTGAGDAYHGAFLYALLQDWDVPRMARFASAVGSLNCRAMGGRNALPTRSEVDQFLARQGY
ncbi:MAG: PfkB family carbohydrate kinase [Chloroflexota bacterium]|nr:PfkB family carbohydrate kinase [Chloroflexota bacterium]MDE2946017.1 PfkB family carbohydrate kinase [Chloroflexota bacterium]